MKTVRNDPVKQRMLDFSQCSDLGEAHRAIRRELELPEWYGRNLDALWDSLTGIMYLPAEVTIVYDPNHKDKALAAEIDKVIEVFRDAEVKCPEIVVHVRANETRPQAAAVMGENMKDLQGVFPALITPFDTDGQVNEDALRQLVRLGLRQGVSGFYVGGSSAEAFLLTQEERRRILETVTDEAAGEAAIIAHVGCMSTGQAIELARHAEACGADAVSSVAPFYYPFSFEELKRYYLDILDSCGLPMVVYNFPGASGVSLKLEQMAELVAHPRVIGVKHTSSDYFLLERL
ncbi:MAG: dihydrodipicolinate synthase family protein, partial [Oscillospiraceae bacterium]|nr:dihydrodipicolinate synthase family protein [Oscillospiraceae bacterium]